MPFVASSVLSHPSIKKRGGGAKGLGILGDDGEGLEEFFDFDDYVVWLGDGEAF